jgi:hypothetical protein
MSLLDINTMLVKTKKKEAMLVSTNVDLKRGQSSTAVLFFKFFHFPSWNG